MMLSPLRGVVTLNAHAYIELMRSGHVAIEKHESNPGS